MFRSWWVVEVSSARVGLYAGKGPRRAGCRNAPLVGRKTGQRPKITPLMAGFDPFFAPRGGARLVDHAVRHRLSPSVIFYQLVLVLVPLGTGSATVFWAQRAAASAFTRCRGCAPPAEIRPAVAMPRQRAETRDNAPNSACRAQSLPQYRAAGKARPPPAAGHTCQRATSANDCFSAGYSE